MYLPHTCNTYNNNGCNMTLTADHWQFTKIPKCLVFISGKYAAESEDEEIINYVSQYGNCIFPTSEQHPDGDMSTNVAVAAVVCFIPIIF